jgi:hypothetical protein
MMMPTTPGGDYEDSNSDSDYLFVEHPSRSSDDENKAAITVTNAPTIADIDEQLLTLMAMAPRRTECTPPPSSTHVQTPLWTSFATVDDGRDDINLDEGTPQRISDVDDRSTSGVVFQSEDAQQIMTAPLFETNNSGKCTAEAMQLSGQLSKADSNQQDDVPLCTDESIVGLKSTVLRDEVETHRQ